VTPRVECVAVEIARDAFRQRARRPDHDIRDKYNLVVAEHALLALD